MKLTADANVLFSALIRSGVSRKIIFHADLELNTPYFFLTELRKYRRMLVSKSGLSKEDFDTFENVLLENVEIIAEDELRPYVAAAGNLIDDDKDLLYIAAALCTGSAIVSNDKDLRRQKRIRVYTIEQLARELRII